MVLSFGHALFTLCFDFSRRLKRARQTAANFFSVALDFLAAISNDLMANRSIRVYHNFFALIFPLDKCKHREEKT